MRLLKPNRRGSVLLLILVIVVLIALGAYTFSDRMLIEFEASSMAVKEVQARAASDSAAEYVATLLADRTTLAEDNVFHNPAAFAEIPASGNPDDPDTPRFTIITANERDPLGQSVRYGVIDESAKLNLALLRDPEVDEETARNMLINLPGMTIDLADAILDWVDEDDDPREFGAESDDYMALDPPYQPRNDVPESLDELLLVSGMTYDLLYGEDANRNGLLDANENDSELRAPWDDANGILYPGLAAYLTVHSRESNLRSTGEPKINVNQSLLFELYDSLLEEFTEDEARFITAMRISGPNELSDEDDLSGGGGGMGSEEEALKQLAEQLGGAIFQGSGGEVNRGGLNLTAGGRYELKSLYELIGTTVDAEVDGKRTTLTSPWPADSGVLQAELPRIFDALTLTDDEYIEGRININQARYETLLGLPGMTETLADAIVNAQMIDSSGQPLLDVMQSHATTGWLLVEGLVDLEQMVELDPYITARGDVVRVQALGYVGANGPVTRCEAVIDATQVPPRILQFRELDQLGRGYPREMIAPTLTAPQAASAE